MWPGIGGQDGLDRFGRLEGGVVLVIDGDAVEQCPVEHPPLGGFGLGVDVADVGEESEDCVEPDLGLVVGGFQRFEPAGDRLQARADAVLLGLEQVERDRVGVVSLEELDLLGFEPGLLPGEELLLIAGGFGEGVEHLPEHTLDLCCLVGAEGDVLVAGLDGLFDTVGEDGGALAVVTLEPAAGAGEVVVSDALVVAGPLEHEPFPAAAVDRAFEVVVVLLRLVADDVVLPQDRLHLLERLRRHERIVRAGVGDVAEGDDALVVGVGEDLVQRGRGDRLRGERRRGPGGEAAGLQFAGELRQGPVAGGVGGEREPDQLGPVGVEPHLADFAPVRIGGADVEVADGGPVRGAADRGFLHESLGDLLGEVQGVELGDGGHDAVHEHAGRGLVDVLHDGHERDPGLAEGGVDDRVIEPVPRDAVDLVDDAVPDGVLGEVIQHLLERFAAGSLPGLAGLDELRDDDRVQLVSLALRGVALRGDGEPFVETVAGGLVLGGDPQVRDRGHLPIRKGRCFAGLFRAGGEDAQGAEVKAGGEIDERHGRDCLSGSHPAPALGVGAGADWRSRHRWEGLPNRDGLGQQMGKPVAPWMDVQQGFYRSLLSSARSWSPA
nr:hypothetical protein [Tessaracoccus timonensis]